VAHLLSALQLLVLVLWLLVLGRVVVSWVDPMARSTPSRYVVMLTEPMLAPIRRILPPTGMLDLSPLVLMIGLGLLLRIVAP
jgi:YggT family protein